MFDRDALERRREIMQTSWSGSASSSPKPRSSRNSATLPRSAFLKPAYEKSQSFRFFIGTGNSTAVALPFRAAFRGAGPPPVADEMEHPCRFVVGLAQRIVNAPPSTEQSPTPWTHRSWQWPPDSPIGRGRGTPIVLEPRYQAVGLQMVAM